MIIYACALTLGRIYNFPLFRSTLKKKNYLDKLPWRVHKLTRLLERVVLNTISTWRLRGGFSIHGYSVITEKSVPPNTAEWAIYLFITQALGGRIIQKKWHLHFSHHIIFVSVNWSFKFSHFFFFKTTEETEMEQVASWSSVKIRPQFDEVGKKTERSSGLALFRNMHFIIRKKKGIKRMIWWPYS